MVRDKGKLHKKIFGVKYTRQPAPEHLCLDEGINPILSWEEKTHEKVLKWCPQHIPLFFGY